MKSLLQDAIEFLGGPSAAAIILKRRQPTISGYLRDGNPPADVCMRIEVATSGKFPAAALRPDLAPLFADFRQAPKRQRRAA